MAIMNPGIFGNDTASTLFSEYIAVFSRNAPELAVAKLDKYVRSEFRPEDWPDYVFSLAEFMWSRGILTDEVRDRAAALVDSGAGLLLWEEAEDAAYRARKSELQALRQRLFSPQPRRRKVRIRMHTKPVFCTGDVIALQLTTAGAIDMPDSLLHLTGVNNEQFRSYDGKWIAIRKVEDHIGYSSVVEPIVRDIWPVFQLYGKIFDEKPSLADLKDVPWADTGRLSQTCDGSLGLFWTEGNLTHFRRRNFELLGNDTDGLIDAIGEWDIESYISLRPDGFSGRSDASLLTALLPLDPHALFAEYLIDDDEELPF